MFRHFISKPRVLMKMRSFTALNVRFSIFSPLYSANFLGKRISIVGTDSFLENRSVNSRGTPDIILKQHLNN
jgi:hypothetical protein